jgi:histone-lysine N-methyltransferase SETMAR
MKSLLLTISEISFIFSPPLLHTGWFSAKLDMDIKMEQRVIIKFLVTENCQAIDIHRRLLPVFGEHTLSLRTVQEWASRFRNGRDSVGDDARSGRPNTGVNEENIERVKAIVDSDRRVSIQELVETLSVSVGTVETIMHQCLGLQKVSARWVPKMLSAEQKKVRLEVCSALLARYALEGMAFLGRIITADETWIHFYEPESKQASMQWKHADSPPPLKFRAQPSAGKVMAIFFWDIHGVILTYFVPEGHTVTGQLYSNVLSKELRQAIKEKRRGLLTRGVIIQHDNARPHTCHLTTGTILDLGWEVLPHPPYSPDLAPSDFHLFGDMKGALRGRHFSTRSGLGSAVYQYLQTKDEDWFTAGIQKLPHRWEKCRMMSGNYVEK